jgi:hypothetical protein
MGARAMVSGGELVQKAYESGLPRMFGMLAAIWQLTLLIQVLSYSREYRQPAVAVAVWLGLVAAAVWLVPRSRAGGLTRSEAAVAVGVAVAAVALFGCAHRLHGAAGSVDWSIFGTSWLLALVAVSRPAWEWCSGALLVFAAHVVFYDHVLGVTALSLARLAASAYALVVILVIFAALQPTVRSHARMAARHAALASRSAAERAAVAAVREDRRERLALLEVGALPLLRGVADGTLDPADSEVRERCARHAAAMRRALADQPHGGAGLLAELGPALRAARARGLPLEVQVVGDPGPPPPEVACAALAAVDRLLSALPPHQVILTVLAAGDDVELYVAFDRPPQATPEMASLQGQVPAVARWSAAVDVGDDGAGCLEIRWRNTAPSSASSVPA